MNDPGAPPGRSHTSGQDILLPLGAPPKRKQHTMILEINSRDRNLSAYPTPSNFRIRFQRPLKDVCSIQLVGGTIPTRIFNIDNGWNQFTFQEGSTNYTITLNPGRYSANYLAVELASKLNTISRASPAQGNTYSAQISPITDQLTITRDHGNQPFSLLFSSGIYVDVLDRNNALIELNSPRKCLGFNLQDYSDAGAGIITSPLGVDLEFLLNRMYLFLNHENTQNLGVIERSIGRLNPHAILYMDESKLYKTFTRDLFQPTFFASPTPISRIATLDVALRDEFDRFINLNGHDFTLLFEITYLN